jgi:chemotaxis protein MotB
MGSSVLLDKDDPRNPTNRRISIVVMNKKTEDAIARDGAAVTVTGGSESEQSDAAEALAQSAHPRT